MTANQSRLPLVGIKVLEFTHAVMGPAAGVILADLGAKVIHVEPPEGDSTRRLKGFGIGYFPFFNRNKQSIAIDIKSEPGREIVLKMVEETDVLIENFGPGTMDRLGYSYETLSRINPRLIYCSLKGFLPGPYEKRTAMDEVVQMMGGLAYMTGPPGQPLRAGTSIIDVMGGTFGALGVIIALYDRNKTGKGSLVKSALFETTAFTMGQHMAYAALTGGPVPPMPARVSAWSIYRLFSTCDGEQVFIGIVSEKHWRQFCSEFNRQDLLDDERLNTNNDRIRERERLLPEVEKMIATCTKDEVIERCERAGIPFAPIGKPEDLFEDVQLNQGGSLVETTLQTGIRAKMPKLPIRLEGHDFGLKTDPPATGAQSREVLRSMGYNGEEIDKLIAAKVITATD